MKPFASRVTWCKLLTFLSLHPLLLREQPLSPSTGAPLTLSLLQGTGPRKHLVDFYNIQSPVRFTGTTSQSLMLLRGFTMIMLSSVFPFCLLERARRGESGAPPHDWNGNELPKAALIVFCNLATCWMGEERSWAV